ncbi:MAG: capsular polysaccharide synthesis protein [Methanobacteriaceae archaeon]|nr:capsular polysaccharide synthesis protein [Methanobacteriaceae archaeon]
MNKNGFQEPPAVKRRLEKKHETMITYFEKMFEEYLKNYDYNKIVLEEYSDMDNRIWICWWQGIDNAPELVKRCVESIQKNSGKYKVEIITDKNYSDFVDIPKWIEEKRKKGIITQTNYSDLLRLSLLAKYGGMWLDATFFCAHPIIEEYFEYPLWSIKRPDYLHCSVAAGYFAGYSLKCNLNNRWIFVIIRDFFLNYWKNNDRLIDYLLVDYMIALAQRQDIRISKVFNEIIPNNPCCDELCKVLGEEFDEKLWNELKKETGLFKLTWKKSYPKEIKGCKTFYGKLLDGEL